MPQKQSASTTITRVRPSAHRRPPCTSTSTIRRGDEAHTDRAALKDGFIELPDRLTTSYARPAQHQRPAKALNGGLRRGRELLRGCAAVTLITSRHGPRCREGVASCSLAKCTQSNSRHIERISRGAGVRRPATRRRRPVLRPCSHLVRSAACLGPLSAFSCPLRPPVARPTRTRTAFRRQCCPAPSPPSRRSSWPARRLRSPTKVRRPERSLKQGLCSGTFSALSPPAQRADTLRSSQPHAGW